MEHKSVYKTKLRSCILSLFVSLPSGSFSAQEIYELLGEKGEKANLTSVYRNLESMTNEGILIRFRDSGSDKATYQYAGRSGECRSHLHIKCISCGEMSHLDCDFMNLLERHIFEDHGFSILCDRSTLYGLCRRCAEERESMKQ